MKTEQITAIGRPVDPNYPTNRAILIIMLVVLIGGAVWQWLSGAAMLAGLLWGVQAGLGVFLAWAMCRELDPDHDLRAFPAAGLALIALFWGQPDLMVLFWMLLVIRVVNRTPGIPATWLDSLLIAGLSGWLVWQRGNALYGIVATLAFLLDSQIQSPSSTSPTHSRNQKQVLFAGAVAVVTLVWAVLEGHWPEEFAMLPLLATLVMGALFVPVLVASRRVEAVGDQSGAPLSPRRVQAGQGLLLLAGVGLALCEGSAGIVSVTPFWAAVVGAVASKIVGQ